MDAIRDQLEKNTVEKVAIYIFEVERNVVLEKWTFDLSALPIVEKADRDIPFERQVGGNDDTEERFSTKINIADLEAQFRAVLNRISAANDRLSALPSDPECSFTVSIEIRDDADRPVGRLEKEERKWIPAEPEPWNENEDQRGDSHAGSSEGTKMAVSENKSRTVAVRRLEAGELRMEVWVEESGAKLAQKKIP